MSKSLRWILQGLGCSVFGGGCLTMALVGLLVVGVFAAAGSGNKSGNWVFNGGAPDGEGSLTPPSGPTDLFTPTPIPADCLVVNPTPVIVTATPVAATPTPPEYTPAGSPESTTTAETIKLPTPTPCPPPPNGFYTPNPNWTPVPAGYGPHGNPFMGCGGSGCAYWITQEFGCTDFPEFKDVGCVNATGGRRPWFHRGFDMVSRGDKTVMATISGEVIMAGWGDDGFGNRVYIRSGEFLCIYPHLSRVLAYTGQHVEWGQPIGVEGSTGYSTGSHLHYQIEINGHWQDPVPYLNR